MFTPDTPRLVLHQAIGAAGALLLHKDIGQRHTVRVRDAEMAAGRAIDGIQRGEKRGRGSNVVK